MVWNNQHLWANFQSINQLHFFHQICIFTYSIRTRRGSIIRNILEANIIKQLDAITTGWWWLLPRECHTIKNKREGKGTNVTRNRRRSYPQAWIASREMNWICGDLVVKFQIYKNQQLLQCMRFWWTQYRKMSNGWNAWIRLWRWYTLKYLYNKNFAISFYDIILGFNWKEG